MTYKQAGNIETGWDSPHRTPSALTSIPASAIFLFELDHRVWSRPLVSIKKYPGKLRGPRVSAAPGWVWFRFHALESSGLGGNAVFHCWVVFGATSPDPEAREQERTKSPSQIASLRPPEPLCSGVGGRRNPRPADEGSEPHTSCEVVTWKMRSARAYLHLPAPGCLPWLHF